jgi:hypothetical protein
MSLNGKRDDFARTDILAVGRRRLARRGRHHRRSARSLARWPQYAAEAGAEVADREIAAAHRQLARSPVRLNRTPRHVCMIRMAIPADGERLAAIYAPAVTDRTTSFELTAPDAREMARR